MPPFTGSALGSVKKTHSNTSGGGGPTPPPQAVAAGYSTLVFQEEWTSFSTSGGANPTTITGNKTWYNGIWYQQNPPPSASYYSWDGNSKLTLTLPTSEVNVNLWLSTYQAGAGTFDTVFTHGYYEANFSQNATVAGGAVNDSNWNAWWLEGAAWAKNGNTNIPFPELDIYENFNWQNLGAPARAYWMTIHDWTNGNNSEGPGFQEQVYISDLNNVAGLSNVNLNNFNTYGLLWTPGSGGKLTSYFNDVQLGQVNAATDGTNDMPCMAIIGPQPGQHNNPVIMTIDWIRIWGATVQTGPF